jgi:hypothetical protein
MNGGAGGNADTGSLLRTASVSLNTITFTKGDGSTFPITVNTGSGGITPTLQEVLNTGNGVSNYGGIGSASIQSTNFTNGRTLYLNDNSYPTIRLVDNANASNNLQIDIDTLSIDGVSYNWSSIVNPPIGGALLALPFTTDHLAETNNPYVIGDVVWYLGDVYRCIANNDSMVPTATSYWTNLGAGFPLVQQPSDWNSTSGNNQILNKPTIPTLDTSSLVTTSSFNDFTSSYTTGSFTGSFTGDLIGTASWAMSASVSISSSYALTASYAMNGGGSGLSGGTDTYIPLWSGSSALTSSFLNQSGSTLKATYNNVDNGLILDISRSMYYLGDFGNVNSECYLQLTPSQGFAVISDSGDYPSRLRLDHNIFSTDVRDFDDNYVSQVSQNSTSIISKVFDDTNTPQVFTEIKQTSSSIALSGSVAITGSLTNIGPAVFSGSVISTLGFTGSLQGTASFASTASYVKLSQTASYVTSSNVVGTVLSASYALTASYVSSNYQNEIHVSKDGSDVTGDGTLLKPFLTITQGLTIVAGTRKTIVLHPGSYSESPNITVQYTVITTFALLGGNTEIVGTVSTSTGCTISGIKITNINISNLTGTGNVNILNCDISGTLTKSSTGDYTLIRFCDIGTTNITSSAGTVAIFGGNPNLITVNNAGARVIVKNSTTVAPVLTAGSLSLVDCIIFAITGTSNAFTAAAGTFTTIANSQLIVPTFQNFARVSIAGFYSIINTVYDRALSTLSGTSTNSIVNSQYINADNINSTQGLTVTGSLNITGSQTITGSLTATQNISASSFTGSLFGTATTASYVVTAQTASYVLQAVSASYALTASYAMNGGGGGTPGGSNTQIQYNNAGAFGGVDKLTYDGTNLVGTGSFTGSFTGQFNGSITTAVTASHAVDFVIERTLTLDESLTDFTKSNSTIVGSNNLFQQATGSYTSAHGKYTLYKGTNARAGEFVTVWNGTTTTYYDNATTDIGSTSDITFQSSVITNQIQINATALSSGWTVKMIVTYL